LGDCFLKTLTSTFFSTACTESRISHY